MWNRSLGFTRWHDRVPELAQAMRMMEKLPEERQRLISQVAIQSIEMSGFTTQREDGLKKLGTEKILGLMKSKTRRRWYDQDSSVHRTFIYLYLMDDPQRREFGLKILISIKALEQLEEAGFPASQATSPANTANLVKSIFNQHLPSLISKTGWRLNSEEPEQAEKEERQESHRPTPSPGASRQASTSPGANVSWRLAQLFAERDDEYGPEADLQTDGKKVIRIKQERPRSALNS